MGCSFSEWDSKNSELIITDAILTLQSVERSEGKVRVIGKNDSNRVLTVAAGIIIGDDAPYPINNQEIRRGSEWAHCAPSNHNTRRKVIR